MKIKKDLLNGDVFEQLMLLFFPVFFGYLLQQTYGFVDAIVLGKFVGKAGLAGVGGSATAIINVILNVIVGITASITVLVAQNYGKGDTERVNNIIKTGFFLCFSFGGILTAVILLFSPMLLNMMNEPAESIKYSLIYLRLYAFSFVPYFIYQMGVYTLRGLGDNKRPNYFILIIAVTKIGFDLLFAGVMKLGVFGTSLATFLSYLICAIVIILMFELTPDIYRFSLKQFGYDKEEIKNILKMGIPFAIQNATYALPGIVLQTKLNNFGTDAVAAYSAYTHIDNIFWCYANTVSTILITIVGQNYGNGNIARVKKIVYTAIKIEIFGSLFFGITFNLFSQQILSIFLNEMDVIKIGVSMLFVTSTKYLLHIFVGTIGSTCKGCGMVKFPSTTTIFTILIVRIAFLILYPHSNAADPLYCFPLSWAATSTVYAIYFFTNKKFKGIKAA